MSLDRIARSAPAPARADLCAASASVDLDVARGRLKAAQQRTLLTAAEAAAYLRMNLDAFYSWRLRHRIANAIPGRALRFRLDDLVIAQSPTPARDTVVDFAELGRQHARRGFRA